MKKTIITHKQINNLLKEELSISKMVMEISNNIKNYIFEKLDTYAYNKKALFESDFSFDLKEFSVNVIFLNVRNRDELFEWIEKNRDKAVNGYSYKDNKLFLFIISINGNINLTDLVNTIQHEVEHYWQCYNVGNNVAKRNYYDIVSLLNNNNIYIQNIAEIIYLTKKFELDVQLNGAYNEAKFLSIPLTYKDFLNKTSLVTLINKLKSLLSSVNEWNFNKLAIKEALNTLEKYFSFNGKNPQKKLSNMLINSINYIYKKSIKIFYLLNKDVNIQESYNLTMPNNLFKNTLGLL